ncbi:bifunctional riboflavin kinase/FAD synthetase [Flavobacterium ardleyense]|uniref:Riboflavin biosynthesis protein n=1 Tax=Flavobacterium ardleyense TaxID=2038737 RepID=A0ABW5Z6A0_9FLAO
MKTYNSIFSYSSKKKTIFTLGTFDGVHIGHQSILGKLKKATADGLYESVVLTFFPHPRMVLNQDVNIKLLNTIDEKATLLDNFGIDSLIVHPFDETFSKLTAEDFVKNVLVKQLNIHKIIIGYDHRFGINRSANIDDLISFGKKYNFEVEQISAKEIDAISVSSTKIRKALLDGNVKISNDYLGIPYSFSGQVVEGKKNGRIIGYRTANIQIKENYKLIPKTGVYIVSCEIKNKLLYGMMNIGKNPTIGDNEQTIEVHFFNFNEDIYGKNLTISVLEHIRSEKKFESLAELQSQLDKDKQFSLDFISQHETTLL